MILDFITMNRLIDFFQNIPVQNILDIGTGSGDFLVVLEKAFPNASITGIDPNSESLKTASEKFPDVVFRIMGAENIEFPDNSFNVVSISMALHHLPDIDSAFKEMRRVLKPEGWIIVSELFSDNLNPAQEVHKMYHHFGSGIDRITGVSHNEAFKKDEILRIIKDSGIDTRFQFEFNKKGIFILSDEEIEERVEKMRSRLELAKDAQDYKLLKPKIEEFRNRATEFGFQTATRVVVIGKF